VGGGGGDRKEDDQEKWVRKKQPENQREEEQKASQRTGPGDSTEGGGKQTRGSGMGRGGGYIFETGHPRRKTGGKWNAHPGQGGTNEIWKTRKKESTNSKKEVLSKFPGPIKFNPISKRVGGGGREKFQKAIG